MKSFISLINLLKKLKLKVLENPNTFIIQSLT